jgi:hypothetical protein
VCAAVLVAAAPGVSPATAGAAGASAQRAPGAEFCSGFADYFAASVVVQFAVGLADAFDTGHTGKAEEVRTSFLLVLSPKLELVTRTMAQSGPALLRPPFAKQAKAFGIGVGLLRKAGLTEAQITGIAQGAIDSGDTSLEQLTANLNVDAAAIGKATLAFRKQLTAVDLGRVPKKQRQAFSTAGTQCGVFPKAHLDCTKLVTPDEAIAALGLSLDLDSSSPCLYVGPTPATGDTPSLSVDVYVSAFAFSNLTKSVQNQDVPGVGERAVAIAGSASFSSINTCGKSLVTLQGDRTVVVALCLPNNADVPIDTLTSLATKVLTRLQ